MNSDKGFKLSVIQMLTYARVFPLKKNYPSENLKPKSFHLVHYGRAIGQFNPPKSF